MFLLDTKVTNTTDYLSINTNTLNLPRETFVGFKECQSGVLIPNLKSITQRGKCSVLDHHEVFDFVGNSRMVFNKTQKQNEMYRFNIQTAVLPDPSQPMHIVTAQDYKCEAAKDEITGIEVKKTCFIIHCMIPNKVYISTFPT